MAKRTMTVKVKGHGCVEVYRAKDEAGNARMVPLHGAATLEEWRADQTKLPPWVLEMDLETGQDWGAIMDELRELEALDLADEQHDHVSSGYDYRDEDNEEWH